MMLASFTIISVAFMTDTIRVSISSVVNISPFVKLLVYKSPLTTWYVKTSARYAGN